MFAIFMYPKYKLFEHNFLHVYGINSWQHPNIFSDPIFLKNWIIGAYVHHISTLFLVSTVQIYITIVILREQHK
jgi:hypothetical protein